MLCSEILKAVSSKLNDEIAEARRYVWTSDSSNVYSLMDSLNAGVREVVNQRPDATADTRTITLTMNTPLQSIPSDATSIIDMLYNVTVTDGVESISTPIFRVELDALRTSRGWGQKASAITNWAYNKLNNRREYWVYPIPSSHLKVKGIVSKTPSIVSSVSDTFPLSDEYANAVECFILADILMGDYGESNPTKANVYLQAFANALQVKLTTDIQFPARTGGTNDTSA